MKTVVKALESLTKSLAAVAQECARYESEQILQHVFNCSRNDLYLKTSQAIDDTAVRTMQAIVTRRLSGEPLAYILGSVFFYSMEILVNRSVLIPRPETEVLVDTILKAEPQSTLSFVDVGTGSGAILAALCKERPIWRGLGIDNSVAAIKTARQNCRSIKSRLLCCDMFSSLMPSLNQVERFDFIVCNPPYIARDEMKCLDVSVTKFEPHSALYGGEDGMDYYRILAVEVKKLLKSGGRMYCEIGFSQGEAVKNIFSNSGWNGIKIIPDLEGRQRVISAYHN